ncbi:hypothetical protein J6590_081664, partial [Homalodisca vitripennis]
MDEDCRDRQRYTLTDRTKNSGGGTSDRRWSEGSTIRHADSLVRENRSADSPTHDTT